MDTKEDILDKAEELFLKYGFRSVTMDDIARGMAISKKTLYQHFKNKDDLVEKVVKNHIEREHEMIRQLQTESTNALDEMVRIAKMYAMELEKISPSAVYDLQKYYGRLWEETLHKQDEFDVECIKKNLKRGRKEGYYRKDMEDEIVAKIFNKATMVLINDLTDNNAKFSRRKIVKELHNYHMHSIATPKGIAEWKELSKSI